MNTLPARQIHLDFHTSEHIPDIAKNFDAARFSLMAKDACIDSMTVFARCHHGWLYYPSELFPQLVHPQLENRNLLFEQVDALHAIGAKAPVYITVQWDYQSATTRPEWLIRKKDGSHEGPPFTQPGFYQSLCVNTGYYDYLAAQTEEVCQMLAGRLDGVFFDITGIRPCWCAACRAEMKELGVDMEDDGAVRAFAKATMTRFKANMTALVRQYSADCTIFYNAGHVGPSTKESADSYSHFELESLPSGSWGYLHFPVTARYARTLGKDCLGMTGKFHTEWGDFHSLKNTAALEFECFRMLSYGFACSIGDQLEPRGSLNPATYRLIGSVYSQVAEREPWARPAIPLVEAALLTGESIYHEHEMPDDVMGAAQLLEELAVQFDIIDPEMDFAPYGLLIVPDGLSAPEGFAEKLDAYVAAGGRVLACGKGGLSAAGQYPAAYGVTYAGDTALTPDFIVAEGPLAQGLEPGNEYVIYQQGVDIRPAGAAAVLPSTAPYFARKGDWFCSHRYTPSSGKPACPAATQKGNVLFFRHPLFSQYRQNAPRWCKRLVGNAIGHLLGGAQLVAHNGPSTLSVSVLHQPEKNRYAIHLLSYVPVRKSANIDIIEERTRLASVMLEVNLPHRPARATLVPEGTPLALEGGVVTVPEIDGYAIVELAYGE